MPTRAWCAAAAPVLVSCQANGTHKYMSDTVGKGCYEVIGTLQSNGTIAEMNTVFMGENFGASKPTPSALPAARACAPRCGIDPPLSSDAPRSPARLVRVRRPDLGMYAEMVTLTHQYPDIF